MRRTALATAVTLSLAAHADNLQQSDASHTLTLYQSDMAMVSSTFTAPAASQRLNFNGLPRGLLPQSVQLTGNTLTLQRWTVDQSFEQRLQAMIGEDLTLEHIDSAQTRSGRLLGFNGALFEFEYQGSVMRYPVQGKWQPRLPSYDPSQTELSLQLGLPLSQPDFELSYLSRGFSWAAEYQIELQGEDSIDLRARAALFNRSEADFSATTLNLLAGNPRTPQQIQPMMEMRALAAAPMADAVAVTQVQGYQLFRLPQRYELSAGSSQRVPLFEAAGLSASVNYRINHNAYQGRRPGIEQQYAQQQLSFELDETRIDKPLPSGEVQLFKRDTNNQLQFVGSQQLGQYSPGQSIDLNYGEVFDLRAQRRQTDYQRNGNTYLQGYEVKLINGANKARVVEYQVDVNEQWSLEDSSQLATADGMQVRWLVEVPAKGETTLSYTLRLVR